LAWGVLRCFVSKGYIVQKLDKKNLDGGNLKVVRKDGKKLGLLPPSSDI